MQYGNQDLPQQLVHQLNVLRSDMLQLEASGMPSNGSIARSAAPQKAPPVSLEPYTPPLNRSFILDGVASTH